MKDIFDLVSEVTPYINVPHRGPPIADPPHFQRPDTDECNRVAMVLQYLVTPQLRRDVLANEIGVSSFTLSVQLRADIANMAASEPLRGELPLDFHSWADVLVVLLLFLQLHSRFYNSSNGSRGLWLFHCHRNFFRRCVMRFVSQFTASGAFAQLGRHVLGNFPNCQYATDFVSSAHHKTTVCTSNIHAKCNTWYIEAKHT